MGQYQEVLKKSLSLGALNLDMMSKLIDEGVLLGITKDEIEKEKAQSESSALDLHLSGVGWQLRGTFKPKSDEDDEVVEYLVQKNIVKPLTKLDEGEVLNPGNVYLIKLRESLILKEKLNLYAQASGKSSIGRLDVLTRLLIDNSPVYDEIPNGYRGDLYVEVIPLSFPILIKKGFSVNQIRLFHGDPEKCLLRPELLEDLSKTTPIIFDQNGQNKLRGIEKLSIDLSSASAGGCCAFVAKRDVEFEPIDISKKNFYDPKEYWDPVVPNGDSITMAKDSFYILRSKERFYLPDDIAVRCIAYTENLGETRIHYAGFAHPWFARSSDTKTRKGAPLIFEVRCHSFPVQVRDGEEFARIEFYRMAEPTAVKNPDYDLQELKLSKCFREWK